MSNIRTNSKITHQRLLEMLEYFPDTGEFFWKNRKQSRKGKAGSLDKSTGYLRIALDGIRYKAHRLAWLYVYEEWPKKLIDHIDQDKLNNRISNLRDVSQVVNSYNTDKAYGHSHTGFLGVSKVGNRFYPRLKIEGKLYWMGGFNTPEEASKKYTEKKSKVLDEIAS